MAQTRLIEMSPAPAVPGLPARRRPAACGKFLCIGDDKLWARGVTYGTFRPTETGGYRAGAVERDFAQMAANGVNAVRTYSVPPRWLLDAALRHGLRVMVGVPWEQHVTFLDDRRRARSILQRVGRAVRTCAGHPAVLCYAVGNEIPASVVRWHGRRSVERFIERLYLAAKAEDPGALVTYVNYPTTEYLELPFLDLVCFNVYLESPEPFAGYLSRLHNVAGDRPLVMTELGLDSRRHGEEGQARAVDWQVRQAFAGGCAGVFVFAWTDEWHRGGHDIEDWDFGLTTRDRRPKAALGSVRTAFAEVPVPKGQSWPRISVVVCSYNGARTIRHCFEGLLRVEYPDFEVIVVDDGSTDDTSRIAKEYGFRLIRTDNRGLSRARNTGLEAATGEIVAYLDDDARPEPHWLTYLAVTFMTTTHVGVGGPNIPPPGDGLVADCVASSPGGPVHVLLTDTEAEHLPGCNMAFRLDALRAIGGFDSRFRTAGDDVDVCWRIRDGGGTLGFSPAAVVFHHRRNTVRGYWRQQVGYGRAEALLERKWPEKYNPAGQARWAGRVYGLGVAQWFPWRRDRIYHGTWGSAPFQRLYRPAVGPVSALLGTPEWWEVILLLGALSLLGAAWPRLLVAVPVLGVALVTTLLQAGLGAAAALRWTAVAHRARWRALTLTTFLHLLQPLARLAGRYQGGLTPMRRGRVVGSARSLRGAVSVWSERWRDPGDWLAALTAALGAWRLPVRLGGPCDRWDLEARGGPLGAVRLLMAVEEHGAGRQLIRFRLRPRCSGVGVALTLAFALLAGGAAADGAWTASAPLVAAALFVTGRAFRECAAAAGAVSQALSRLAAGGPVEP